MGVNKAFRRNAWATINPICVPWCAAEHQIHYIQCNSNIFSELRGIQIETHAPQTQSGLHVCVFSNEDIFSKIQCSSYNSFFFFFFLR